MKPGPDNTVPIAHVLLGCYSGSYSVHACEVYMYAEHNNYLWSSIVQYLQVIKQRITMHLYSCTTQHHPLQMYKTQSLPVQLYNTRPIVLMHFTPLKSDNLFMHVEWIKSWSHCVLLRGCLRQPLYCFHSNSRYVTLVRYIYIYI